MLWKQGFHTGVLLGEDSCWDEISVHLSSSHMYETLILLGGRFLLGWDLSTPLLLPYVWNPDFAWGRFLLGRDLSTHPPPPLCMKPWFCSGGRFLLGWDLSTPLLLPYVWNPDFAWGRFLFGRDLSKPLLLPYVWNPDMPSVNPDCIYHSINFFNSMNWEKRKIRKSENLKDEKFTLHNWMLKCSTMNKWQKARVMHVLVHYELKSIHDDLKLGCNDFICNIVYSLMSYMIIL